MAIFIQIFLYLLGIYFAIGLLFGLYFFIAGAKKIDPLIAESKWPVRLILSPGAIVMWIFLLPKLFKKAAK